MRFLFLTAVLKKAKHRVVETMNSGTADALGLSRAILCNGRSDPTVEEEGFSSYSVEKKAVGELQEVSLTQSVVYPTKLSACVFCVCRWPCEKAE